MTALITRDELRAEIEAGTVTVVDALPASYRAQQHLPGALNLVRTMVRMMSTRRPLRCSRTGTPPSSPTAPTAPVPTSRR
jgi:hypothetical protein